MCLFNKIPQDGTGLLLEEGCELGSWEQAAKGNKIRSRTRRGRDCLRREAGSDPCAGASEAPEHGSEHVPLPLPLCRPAVTMEGSCSSLAQFGVF